MTDVVSGAHESTSYTNRVLVAFYRKCDDREIGGIKRDKLGVTVSELTDEDKMTKSINFGVHVDVVYEASPAYYSNLRYGDVIMSVDGEYADSISSFYSCIEDKKPGQQIEVTYVREGKEQKATVKLK